MLTLAYRFEPGAPDDGVTVVVPLALLAQLRPDGFDWQVPGLRDELVTALLRALPKVDPPQRRARRGLGRAPSPTSSPGRARNPTTGCRSSRSVEALARLVQRVANQRVSADDFEVERVPAHLQVSFRAVDERGRTVGSDRDLAALQQRLAGRARTTVERSLERSPRTRRP